MTSTKSFDGSRLVALDGLRGWAAAFVAIMHFPLDRITHSIPLISNSFLFVDLFFVLSGFVIAYVYSQNFRAGNSLEHGVHGYCHFILRPCYWEFYWR